MKSKFKAALKGLFLIIVLFVAIVVIINTSPFDEKLNPEVHKLMQDLPIPEIEDNAYYAIYGINVEEGQDIIKAGHELTLRYIENRNNGNDKLTGKDYDEILGVMRPGSSIKKIEINSCEPKRHFNCLLISSKTITSDNLDNPKFQVMLDRYHKIIAMKNYSGFLDLTLGTPLISYKVMLDLSKIKITNSYKQENRIDFIKDLHKDMVFWKLVLNQGKLLIDKMVANLAIRTNINYLSEYLRNNPIAESDRELIAEILKPLTTNELDLSESFITESRSFLNLIETADKNNSWYDNLMFQPNSTTNLYFDLQISKLIKLGQLPLEELIKAHNSDKNNLESSYQLHYIYNFLGKSLLDYTTTNAYTDYIVRGYDLNNIIRMIGIQYQAKISEQQSTQLLLTQPENANLFNGKPFDYDEKSQTLQFECLDKYSECKIKL